MSFQTIQAAPPAVSTTPTTTATPTETTAEGGYRPVTGGGETRSGETLLVQGYIFIWILLMGWLFYLWRKQAALHGRLDALEKVIAESAQSSSRKK